MACRSQHATRIEVATRDEVGCDNQDRAAHGMLRGISRVLPPVRSVNGTMTEAR